MAAIREEGRKGRAIFRVECNDVSFDPICKKETFVPKRFFGSPSACSYSRELIVAHPRRHPPFYLPPFASSAPFGVFSPQLLLFITRLLRKRKRPPRGHHRNVLLSLTQLVYLRHGSKLESIFKKSTSNTGIFSALSFWFFRFSLFHPVRFYLVSSCLQMHANGKRENGKPGVVVSSVERISLRIAIAPGHFCAASGVEIIGCR